MHFFVAYVALAGGISAGLQVTRGVVRGTGRMLAGDPSGALVEVTAGLIAPVAQVYREVGKLTIDVFVATRALTDDSPATEATPEDAWAPQRNGVAR